MKRIAYLAATVAFLAASTAQAAVDPEALGRDWWSQGYTAVEVTMGRTQVKVEGIRDGQKVEVIYDAATGAELKRETGAIEAGDDVHDGITLRQRNRDFVRVRSADESADDDSSDDDHGGSSADDDSGDDDHSGSGSGSDDGADHDSGDDHGGSSSHDGSDDGSDHDSGDDHGGNDD